MAPLQITPNIDDSAVQDASSLPQNWVLTYEQHPTLMKEMPVASLVKVGTYNAAEKAFIGRNLVGKGLAIVYDHEIGEQAFVDDYLKANIKLQGAVPEGSGEDGDVDVACFLDIEIPLYEVQKVSDVVWDDVEGQHRYLTERGGDVDVETLIDHYDRMGVCEGGDGQLYFWKHMDVLTDVHLFEDIMERRVSDRNRQSQPADVSDVSDEHNYSSSRTLSGEEEETSESDTEASPPTKPAGSSRVAGVKRKACDTDHEHDPKGRYVKRRGQCMRY